MAGWMCATIVLLKSLCRHNAHPKKHRQATKAEFRKIMSPANTNMPKRIDCIGHGRILWRQEEGYAAARRRLASNKNGYWENAMLPVRRTLALAGIMLVAFAGTATAQDRVVRFWVVRQRLWPLCCTLRDHQEDGLRQTGRARSANRAHQIRR